ncbi:MAG: monovalent cation:proton antiporter-2 (CPA2) family protein [Pseudomonadota bacterium]
MAAAATPEIYSQAIILMAGAVVAAPIFKRIGLGTVLGYLAAGVVLGPLFGVVQNGESILHFAELGIVFLLFIVGLEMKPSRLWSMRKYIFGLGTAQVLLCGVLLSGVALFIAPSWRMAVVAGFGLALSSTAFALQMLESRGEVNTAYGRRTFSILLFQDLAIIPLLAVLPLFSLYVDTGSDWSAFLIGIGAIGFVIFAGQYLLNPLLSIIAKTGAHEAMIATALLVVFGSAMLMQAAGLSMALGSFLAGVLLAESSYKHELEANIEPFRGILLGLFFMAVGLSLDVTVLAENWLAIIVCVLVAMAIKAICIYGSARVFGSGHPDSIRIAAMVSQHGEFGFVLFASASAIGILDSQTSSFLVAMVVLSMALTPMCVWLGGEVISRGEQEHDDMEEDFEGANSPVLMIGFSRMGQIAAQTLLAAGIDVTVIENNPNVIKQAARFGFRIYFGNGTRKEVLVSAGIENCSMICVSTHTPEITNRIVDLISKEYPDKPIYVRAYDRAHTLQLMDKPVKFHIRETFESALVLGAEMLQGLGHTHEQAEEIVDEVRHLDNERLKVQYREGIYAGQDIMHTRPVIPEPLVEPQHPAEALDERSREMVEEIDDKKTVPAE